MPSPKKPSLFTPRSHSRRSSSGGWDRQIQHGTLRSELDEPAELPPEFSALAEKFDELRQSYDAGELSRAEFAESLSGVAVTSHDGSVWTIGATTGQWYRRFSGGNRWEPAMPPEAGSAAAVTGSKPSDAWTSPTAPLAASPHMVETDPLGAVEMPFPSVTGKGSLAPPPPFAAERPLADSIWGEVAADSGKEAEEGGYGADLDDDSYLGGVGLPPELLSDD